MEASGKSLEAEGAERYLNLVRGLGWCVVDALTSSNHEQKVPSGAIDFKFFSEFMRSSEHKVPARPAQVWKRFFEMSEIFKARFGIDLVGISPEPLYEADKNNIELPKHVKAFKTAHLRRELNEMQTYESTFLSPQGLNEFLQLEHSALKGLGFSANMVRLLESMRDYRQEPEAETEEYPSIYL